LKSTDLAFSAAGVKETSLSGRLLMGVILQDMP
jgi:hypothetical protein